MAICQFGLHFIPSNVATVQGITAGSRITDTQREELIQWKTKPLHSEVFDRLRQLFTIGKSWSENLEVLGDLESTCVTILRERDRVIEAEARLDLRTVSAEIINAILDFSTAINCQLLTDDNKVINPSLPELKFEIKASAAYRFVKDPRGFIADLASDME